MTRDSACFVIVFTVHVAKRLNLKGFIKRVHKKPIMRHLITLGLFSIP